MKLYVVMKTFKSDSPVLDTIFIDEKNMEKYLAEMEISQDEWEQKNVGYQIIPVDTED